MNKVQMLCETASDSSCNTVTNADCTGGVIGANGTANTILIHHSRNTDHKQWAETEV